MPSQPSNIAKVKKYYNRTESRLGYSLILGGTKHFGYYLPGESKWRFGTAMRRMEDHIGRRLALPPGSRILDAGCGVGDVSRAMATRFGLTVDGIDILDFNIQEANRRSAKARLSDRTRFLEADYHMVPFENKCFDGVIAVETLVHATDSRRVLAEFHRVIRPGGKLVMAEYSRTPDAELTEGANAAMEKIFDLGAMPSWRQFTPGVLTQQLSSAGFDEVIEEDVTSHMLPMLKAFYLIGLLPYFAMKHLGKVEKAVNAMSGVETFRHQNAWRYNLYTATRAGM